MEEIMNYAGIIIPFVGGLGMFIYGMQIMAQGLENAAGSQRGHHEPVSGDGRDHGCKYRNYCNRLAGLQCGMGEVFEPVEPGADRDHDRSDPDAHGQKTPGKGHFQYHHRIWYSFRRNNNHVVRSGAAAGVRRLPEYFCRAGT